MNVSETLRSLPDATKKTFNKIQKLNRKLSKARTAVLFNDICIKEDILPKYTNLRLYDHRAKKQPFTETLRRNLVEYQLKQKEEQVKELEQKLVTLHDQLNGSEIEAEAKKKLLSYLDEKTENF